MKAGYYAGIVDAEAVEKGDYSVKTLKKYDELWKKDFGKDLARKRKLQKKLINMDDETLNKIIRSLAECKLEEISIKAIIKELIKKHPKILWDLKDLFI